MTSQQPLYVIVLNIIPQLRKEIKPFMDIQKIDDLLDTLEYAATVAKKKGRSKV